VPENCCLLYFFFERGTSHSLPGSSTDRPTSRGTPIASNRSKVWPPKNSRRSSSQSRSRCSSSTSILSRSASMSKFELCTPSFRRSSLVRADSFSFRRFSLPARISSRSLPVFTSLICRLLLKGGSSGRKSSLSAACLFLSSSSR